MIKLCRLSFFGSWKTLSAGSKSRKTHLYKYRISKFFRGGCLWPPLGGKALRALPISFPCRAVIKSRGPGISPAYYECGPRLLLLENRRKIEPKEIPCCLIPRLLVVFTRQLEILVTTLPWVSNPLALLFNTLMKPLLHMPWTPS